MTKCQCQNPLGVLASLRVRVFLVLMFMIADHTLGRRLEAAQSGTIAGWGYSAVDQLDFPAGLTNIVAVSAGRYHILALRNDHTVVAWGNNTQGQISVPPGLTNVAAVAA